MRRFRVIQFEELESTNTYARLHLRELVDGDVIQALRQTQGRGRLNRTWLSGEGDLCLSLVLKPASEAPEAKAQTNTYLNALTCLSHLMAVCVCRVLADRHIHAQIKWPNDVLVDGRKISGILAETVFLGRDFLGLVLGVGLNCNMDNTGVEHIPAPATSLSVLKTAPVDVCQVRDALLLQFFGSCDELLEKGFPAIRAEYLARAGFLGKEARVRGLHVAYDGTATDVTEEGALVLVNSEGRRRIVAIGEMFVAG